MIPLLYYNFADLKEFLGGRNVKAIGAVILSESLTNGGVIFITLAASICIYESRIALSSLQPFFVLIFSFALTRICPGTLGEDIGNSATLQKLIAIAMIFAGGVLVA